MGHITSTREVYHLQYLPSVPTPVLIPDTGHITSTREVYHLQYLPSVPTPVLIPDMGHITSTPGTDPCHQPRTMSLRLQRGDQKTFPDSNDIVIFTDLLKNKCLAKEKAQEKTFDD